MSATVDEARDELGPIDAAASCPSCGSRGLAIFHEQDDVPVHSCRLVPTRGDAEAFPRGVLRLGLCRRCGFITNAAYDASLQDYSLAYEETQGFSPRFQEFARELAERWVARYHLAGKDVLEIGCGKGEFLTYLLDSGARHGTGIDPSAVDARIPASYADRLALLKEYYSEAHVSLAADAIVCRHTLEHIPDVSALVHRVYRAASRAGTVVLFELPDVLRVLREAAFWDVYYEHCSYFSPGSLARLFRIAGFEVLDLALDYDDQYILIEARPAPDERKPVPHPLEESPADVEQAVEEYRSKLAACKARWAQLLLDVRADGGRAVVWGAGSKGVAFLTTLGVTSDVEYAVDVNPFKQGMFVAGTGQEIVAPSFLREYRPSLVVLMNPIYRSEVEAELRSLSVDAKVIAV